MIQVVRDKEYCYEIFLVEGEVILAQDLGQIHQDSSHCCKYISSISLTNVQQDSDQGHCQVENESKSRFHHRVSF